MTPKAFQTFVFVVVAMCLGFVVLGATADRCAPLPTAPVIADAGTSPSPSPPQVQKIGHVDAKDRPADGGCDVWRVEGSIFAICGESAMTGLR
jgi:hypothetical protein